MRAVLPVLALTLAACGVQTTAQDAAEPEAAAPGRTASAVFAGGCFWCVEAAFEKVDGVIEAVSGYTGGETSDPSYKDVTYGDTGHYEAVEVIYDPAVVDYAALVDTYWRNIDPENGAGQFCDFGASYRTAIFVGDAAEREVAETTKAALEASGRVKAVETVVLDAAPFYRAEDGHQNYYKVFAANYQRYVEACRRQQRLEEIWGEEAGGLATAEAG